MKFQGKSLTQSYGLPSHRATVVAMGLFCVKSIGANEPSELQATRTPAAWSMEDRRGRT